MGKALTLKVPAKVNIHLEVLGKRPDGYHEIVSIFQMVSLYDVLQISSLKYENAFHLEGDFNIKESENLITKTVRLFRKRTGLAGGIQIKVRKRIPPGAGLGGGSSNAAATLKGLNLLLAAELSPIRLKCLAAELGSDIPFFLTWPAALVCSRGEDLEPLPPRTDYWLVLIYPGFMISTREAYRWLDEQKRPRQSAPDPDRLKAQVKQDFLEKPVGCWNFKNSFQTVAERRFPEIGMITKRLKGFGAVQAGISGSGSAVIGFYQDRYRAEKAKDALKGSHPLVTTLKPLAKMPYAGLE